MLAQHLTNSCVLINLLAQVVSLGLFSLVGRLVGWLYPVVGGKLVACFVGHLFHWCCLALSLDSLLFLLFLCSCCSSIIFSSLPAAVVVVVVKQGCLTIVLVKNL